MTTPQVPEEIVEMAARVLTEEGGQPGNSIHSWRCEYPEQYGECDCVAETARLILEAVAPALMASGAAEALESAALAIEAEKTAPRPGILGFDHALDRAARIVRAATIRGDVGVDTRTAGARFNTSFHAAETAPVSWERVVIRNLGTIEMAAAQLWFNQHVDNIYRDLGMERDV